MTLRSSDSVPGRRLDIEQAQAQLELKDRALAASAEGITIADARLPDQPLIYANAGFERLTGYSVAEVLGRNCRFLQGSATDLATVDELRTAIGQQREVTVQLLNYRKDGTPFWNRLSITPVHDSSGEVTHFIGVHSDVTAEKGARDALQDTNQRLEAASEAMKRDLQAACRSPIVCPRQRLTRTNNQMHVGHDSVLVSNRRVLSQPQRVELIHPIVVVGVGTT
jgi:phosphoserine phosphatase RsbU/P